MHGNTDHLTVEAVDMSGASRSVGDVMGWGIEVDPRDEAEQPSPAEAEFEADLRDDDRDSNRDVEPF